MHDDLMPKKMIELSAIAFTPLKSIDISMKRKFATNGLHYRPHLTSASSDISNEEHPSSNVDDCDEEVGKLATNINLPSPPSSTHSSFDNDGVTRDSYISSGDASDHGDVSHFASLSSSSPHQQPNDNTADDADVILEGLSDQKQQQPPQPDMEPGTDNDKLFAFDDDIKLVMDYLVNMAVEQAESSDFETEHETDVVDNGNVDTGVDIEELWKDFQIDFEGETILPNGVRLINGIAEMSFYRDLDQPRFTNQLNFLKTVLTKYICRYKTAVPFLNPVDSVQFKIPHYYLMVREPMDLNTIKNRINFLWYRSADECMADLRLIFTNCYKFNSPTDYVYKAGKKLEEYLDDKLKDMPPVETEIPCPPRPSVEEYQKLTAKRTCKSRTGSLSEHSENGDCIPSAFGPIKMTTRSERGVMVRKPSKDLPTPISTPQPKPPTVRKVPLNEPMKYCLEFVKELYTKKHAEYAWPFWQPVNLADYPDYTQKIKRPIDLSAIKINIESGKYITIHDFANDMRLMFSNCLRYNTSESPIIEQVRKLREQFEFKVARMPDEWAQEKLVVVKHTSSSRQTSPSARQVAAALLATPVVPKLHISSESSHKSKKIKGHCESRKSKGRNSVDNSGHAMNALGQMFNATPSTSSGSGSRMEQLERQVATLTNALQACLFNGNGGNASALLGAMVPMGNTPVASGGTPAPSRGRPRKNGTPAQPKGSTKKAAKKPTSSRKRKHHLSSDEDSDSEPEEMAQPAEPFTPESIEDLKKLKDDLENLPAKDLQNVLRILQTSEPSLACDDESNVEIDFEALKPKTLIQLRKYVTSCMLNSKSSPANHHSATASNSAPASSANSNKKLCQSSNSQRSNSLLDTDCDNSINNNWSRAGSRASDLQLSEESSSDSEVDD